MNELPVFTSKHLFIACVSFQPHGWPSNISFIIP